MQRAISFNTGGEPTDMATVDDLIKSGMTALGARQVVNGEMVGNANDRKIIAVLIGQATAAGKKGHVNYDWVLETGAK